MVGYNLLILASLAVNSAASIVPRMSHCQKDCGTAVFESTDCTGWDKIRCICEDTVFTDRLVECLNATPGCAKEVPSIKRQLCSKCMKAKTDANHRPYGRSRFAFTPSNSPCIPLPSRTCRASASASRCSRPEGGPTLRGS
ncbi:BZ3500_MvSof-1268-A1-R1_Chr7-1g09283 [Microbotryum saponariae]|uniref:BZ3500_MvSof-1268-A1-R1_Chr7-1g09283 protein n=1 Tax=Microbotryum saponariae TaxID=289078 RepID=A0A2X0KX60_9BASI|nr:BZ3501_MvSof-1269-A2-R1_Chr7-1g08988 [Microbotryum saponariae]SDA03153.1 BZ3500_MvSof-1268-A1-R1_Chr7-1g09283 [Microbotryum saponariae]